MAQGQPGFEPTAVSARTRSEQVADQLQAALVAGVLQPGDLVGTEPDLAERFNVSRTTIRAALTRLQYQGVLAPVRGSKGGHFVVRPEPGVHAQTLGETLELWLDVGALTVNEVDEARVAIERTCVAFAALRRTDDDLVAMRAALDGGREDVALEDFQRHDVEFHSAIARAAHNRVLELPMVAIHVLRPNVNRRLRSHDRARVLAQHTAIYEAIEARDPHLAEAGFMAHVEYLAGERTGSHLLLRDDEPPRKDPHE